MGVIGQLHAPAAVFPEKEPSASSAYEAGRSQTDLQNSTPAVTRSHLSVDPVLTAATVTLLTFGSELKQSVERYADDLVAASWQQLDNESYERRLRLWRGVHVASECRPWLVSRKRRVHC